jgi:small subunit ribosomal protein S4
VRCTYGVSESQFRRYYEMAKRTGRHRRQLLQLLRGGWTTSCTRIGFASSRNGARQLVTHGHIQVNGRKVDIPSYLVKAGDVVEVKEKSKKLEAVGSSLENREQRGFAEWLEVDKEARRGRVKALPERKDMPMSVQETLIVEYYSK